MTTTRRDRLRKLADINDTFQSAIQHLQEYGSNFINMLAPDSKSAQPAATTEFNLPGAISYNTRSEETFKLHEDKIKQLLGATADWKSAEFAQAVYNWQKTHGLAGKLVDGKFGPLTMSELIKTDPTLKEQYSPEATSPWLPGGKIKLRLTGYWPFTARPDEAKMEGGFFDRKMPKGFVNRPDSKEYQQHILHTVEQHIADPINHPFVSLSGDDAMWPYGQEIDIPWIDGHILRGRVVDTGSHFRGPNKVYRSPGYEPIDICVNSSQTKVATYVVAQVVGNEPRPQQTQPLVSNIKMIQRIKNARKAARVLVLERMATVTK